MFNTREGAIDVVVVSTRREYIDCTPRVFVRPLVSTLGGKLRWAMHFFSVSVFALFFSPPRLASVGNDAVKHASHYVTQTTRVPSIFFFSFLCFGGNRGSRRVRYCADCRTLTTRKGGDTTL